MGSLNGENLHATRKKATAELSKGKEIAIQLQTLLKKPVKDHGPVSVEELSLQICRSYAHSLSELGSCAAPAESAQIPAVDCGGSSCSGRRRKKSGVSDRRGGYKRRKTSDSWLAKSSTMEDGYAWRKYGQKVILNCKHPRCYFRCTHKGEGCQATKQVQIIEEDPVVYQTTYFNHHTCTKTFTRPPHVIVDYDPADPNLISFQTKKEDTVNPPNPIIFSPVTVEESKERAGGQSEEFSDAKSTLLQDPWQEIVGLESSEYKPELDPMMSSNQEVASGFLSCESTSLDGIEMEVNQLGDVDSFLYFNDLMY